MKHFVVSLVPGSKTGVGNLRPAGGIRHAKQNHPACRPFTNCGNCIARLLVLYVMNLPSLQLLFHIFEELRETAQCYRYKLLSVVFSVFFMNCENQELISI